MVADSRGTIGDPRGLTAINDTQKKLFPLGRCSIAISGASEIGATLLDEFRKRGTDNLENVDDAIALLVPTAADLFKQWFRDIPPERRAGILLLLAGYRRSKDGDVPMLYLLNSQTNFAPQLCQNFMMAGVPQYAIYLNHRYYSPDISLESAQALVEYLITETASQDPKVGGPVKMAVVTPEGYAPLTDEQVLKIHNETETLNARLRQFFYGERKIERRKDCQNYRRGVLRSVLL